MHRSLFRRAGSALALGLFSLCVAVPSALAVPTPNLLSAMNPSFQSGTQGWSSGAGLAASNLHTEDNDDASVELSGAIVGNDISAFSSLVPVTPGSTYSGRMSVFATSQLQQGYKLLIEWFNGSSFLGVEAVGDTILVGDHTVAHVTGTAPANANGARLRLFAGGAQSGGTFRAFLDGAMLVEGGAPSSFYFTPPPNLMSDVNPSFRSGTQGWTSGAGLVASNAHTEDNDGASAELAGAIVGNDISAFSSLVPVTPGKTYSGRMSVFATSQLQQGYKLLIEWFNGSTFLGTESVGDAILAGDGSLARVTGTAPANATRARLRLYAGGAQSSGTFRAFLDGAMLVEGGVPTSFSFDSAPYAIVRESNNNAVARFGSAYAGMPGGQIQAAENYAQCGTASACPTPIDEFPLYSKVTLDAGTFTLTVRSNMGAIKCPGIWAFAAVRLEGLSGTVIDDQIPTPPCGPPNDQRLYALIVVARDPNVHTALSGSAHVSSLQLNMHHKARYGIDVMSVEGSDVEGSDIAVQGNTVTEPASNGILVGDGQFIVKGTPASPALISGNTVTGSADDGITLGGSNLRATNNTVSNFGGHGIVAYSPAGAIATEISYNTISGGYTGVDLDGSNHPGSGASVLSNTISNQCVGITAYQQTASVIAGNTITDPYRGYGACPQQPPPGQDPNSTDWNLVRGTPTGILILDGTSNAAFANQVWHFKVGVWVRDDDPSNGGTHANRIGMDASGTIAGNWINDGEVGILINNYDALQNNEDNYIYGNAVDGSGLAPCVYATHQFKGGNNQPGCN